MALNRDLQQRLLRRLAEVHPDSLDGADFDELGTPKEMEGCVRYLHQHGYVKATWIRSLSGPSQPLDVTITAEGLDSLEPDGGLTAQRRLVVVRLEAETLKALIEARVDASALPAAEKSRIKGLLQKASEEALKEATKALVKLGLENWPKALELLQQLPAP